MQVSTAFLGSKIRKTGEILSTQVTEILKEHSVKLNPRAIPVINILYEKGSISITEIADSVGFTHPAIIQLVNPLIKDKLVNLRKSNSDKRLTILELTQKGRNAFERLEPVIYEISETIESMMDEIDANMIFSLEQLEKYVKGNTLLKRMNEKSKEYAMEKVSIVTYRKKYKGDFRRLNEEWLNKYFVVEDEDKRFLYNPEKEIINKGGEIFFALLENEVVGTSAMIKVDDSTFELAKMAVTEKEWGKQIGKKLMLTSIGFAVEKRVAKIELSTSPKLTSAINLYQNVGFRRIRKSPPSAYKRKLFMMRLDLNSD